MKLWNYSCAHFIIKIGEKSSQPGLRFLIRFHDDCRYWLTFLGHPLCSHIRTAYAFSSSVRATRLSFEVRLVGGLYNTQTPSTPARFVCKTVKIKVKTWGAWSTRLSTSRRLDESPKALWVSVSGIEFQIVRHDSGGNGLSSKAAFSSTPSLYECERVWQL